MIFYYVLDTGNLMAYLCKERNGMIELKKAILEIHEGKIYNSPKIETTLKQENLFVLKKFDMNLLNCIASGKYSE